MYLAENLKFLREQNGKTQGELAVLFGIEQKTISSWECGSRKPPIGTIVSLAKLYRVSLDDLVLTDMRPPIPVYALNLACWICQTMFLLSEYHSVWMLRDMARMKQLLLRT